MTRVPSASAAVTRTAKLLVLLPPQRLMEKPAVIEAPSVTVDWSELGVRLPTWMHVELVQTVGAGAAGAAGAGAVGAGAVGAGAVPPVEPPLLTPPPFTPPLFTPPLA
jgi:hypothetical protein